MWCESCRQDVPGIAAEGKGFACARCGRKLAHGSTTQRDALSVASQWGLDLSSDSGSTRRVDNPPGHGRPESWELDQKVRYRTWRHASIPSRGETSSIGNRSSLEAGIPRPPARSDRDHPETSSPRLAVESTTSSPLPAVKRPILAWSCLLVGGSGILIGATLMATSFTVALSQLWTIGMFFLLLGQVGLLAGLILQLDRVQADQRQARRRLSELDRRLGMLRFHEAETRPLESGYHGELAAAELPGVSRQRTSRPSKLASQPSRFAEVLR